MTGTYAQVSNALSTMPLSARSVSPNSAPKTLFPLSAPPELGEDVSCPYGQTPHFHLSGTSLSRAAPSEETDGTTPGR